MAYVAGLGTFFEGGREGGWLICCTPLLCLRLCGLIYFSDIGKCTDLLLIDLLSILDVK